MSKEKTSNKKEFLSPTGMFFCLFLFCWGIPAYLRYLYEISVEAKLFAKLIHSEVLELEKKPEEIKDLDLESWKEGIKDYRKTALDITNIDLFKFEGGLNISYKTDIGNKRFCNLLNEEIDKIFTNAVAECKEEKINVYINGIIGK